MKLLDNYVIRVGGGVTVFRIKRFLQMMALIICVASVTLLLLYQNAYAMRVIDVSRTNIAESPHCKSSNSCQKQKILFPFVFSPRRRRRRPRQQSYPLSVNEEEASAANVIVDDQPFDSSTEWFRGKNVKNPYSRHRMNERMLMKRRLYEYSVTATPKPTTISLNDIFISVKTTQLYHETRLSLIIKTWFQLAADQVSAFVVN